MNANNACFHCGLPVPVHSHFTTPVLQQPQHFCCNGCLAVATTIVRSGLENYYRDRDTVAAGPATLPDALRLSGYDHPEAQREFLSHEGPLACVELSLVALNCAACAWLIERHLQAQAGIAQAAVNISNHRLHLMWDESQIKLSEILQSLASIGYPARPLQPDAHQAQLKEEGRTLLLRLAIAGFGMMQVMMYAGSIYVGDYRGMEAEYRDYLHWINMLITTPIFFYCGWPFYRSAWRALKTKKLNMDVSVSLALIAAFAASVFATLMRSGVTYYDSVTMFIFFLLTSHFLEMKARQRAGDTAASLMTLTPRLATRLSENQADAVVAIHSLEIGDQLLVKPGETIPADGHILTGHSSISEALITGEALSVEKTVGDRVIGGSINGDGTLTIKVSHRSTDSMLGTLNRLLNRALAEKPLLSQKADTVAHVFVAAVLLLAAMVFTAWWWHAGIEKAFWVTLAVLVATCPCALSLATPTALSSATNHLASLGFLITRGHVLETLSQASHIIFDKTGTLTQGRPVLNDYAAVRGDRQAALNIACALEARSTHPVALAFNSLALTHLTVPDDFQSHPGAGLSGCINGMKYRLGHATFALATEAKHLPAAELEHLWLADEQGALAWFSLSDKLRPEAAHTINELQALGLKTLLFSGDPSYAPEQIGQTLGMDESVGKLTATAKKNRIQQLQSNGAIVIMVGDGVNDVPSLGQAHLAIAMASATDLAQTSADAVLLHNDLHNIVHAYHTARATQNIIRQNLAWAIVYNIAILPPAALGLIPPWLSAIGMSISSLVVVANALRLR